MSACKCGRGRAWLSLRGVALCSFCVVEQHRLHEIKREAVRNAEAIVASNVRRCSRCFDIRWPGKKHECAA